MPERLTSRGTGRISGGRNVSNNLLVPHIVRQPRVTVEIVLRVVGADCYFVEVPAGAKPAVIVLNPRGSWRSSVITVR